MPDSHGLDQVREVIVGIRPLWPNDTTGLKHVDRIMIQFACDGSGWARLPIRPRHAREPHARRR